MKNKINFAEDKSFRRGELYLADMRGLSNQGKTEMLVVVMQNDPGFLSVPTVSVFPWPVKILEAEQQEKRPCSCGETVLVNGDPMVLDKKRIRKYEGTLKGSQMNAVMEAFRKKMGWPEGYDSVGEVEAPLNSFVQSFLDDKRAVILICVVRDERAKLHVTVLKERIFAERLGYQVYKEIAVVQGSVNPLPRLFSIQDMCVLRLVKKYLKSGVMENGVVCKTEEGSPQGGPLSPLLANIYLNEFDWEMGCWVPISMADTLAETSPVSEVMNRMPGTSLVAMAVLPWAARGFA